MGWKSRLNKGAEAKAKRFIQDECAQAKQALSSETLWLKYEIETRIDDWFLPRDYFITLRASMSVELNRQYGNQKPTTK